jgi:hypothetical protein
MNNPTAEQIKTLEDLFVRVNYKLFLYESEDKRCHLYDDCNYQGWFVNIEQALRHINGHINNKSYNLTQHLSEDTIWKYGNESIQGQSWTFSLNDVAIRRLQSHMIK